MSVGSWLSESIRSENRRIGPERCLTVMKEVPHQLLEFLHRYDPAIRSLALDLRTLIHEEMAPCHEYIFAMRSKVVLLYGATERVIDDGICHINVFVRQVNLGFSRGTELEDPAGVLQGTGKAMRHITLKASIDLRRPDIRSLLQEARRNAGLARRQRSAARVTTRVKQGNRRSDSRCQATST